MVNGSSDILRLIAPLELRLDKLRRGIASWLLLDGGSRWVWTLLVVIGVDFLLDFVLRFDRLQRMAILALVVGFLAIRAWKLLVWIPSQRTRNEALCFELQKRNPVLGQSLVTAYELAHGTAAIRGVDVSVPLAEQAIRIGLATVESVSLESMLNLKRMRWNWWRLTFGILILMGLQVSIAIMPSPLPKIWFQRNVLLREVPWPQDVYLHIEGEKDGVIRAYRGEDWQVVVNAEAKPGHLPQSVTLEFRGGVQRAAQIMKEREPGSFELTLSALRQSFELRARGGGVATPWYPVELIDPPAVEELELVVEMPEYTASAPIVLPAGQGPYPVLAGSALKLAGRFNKAVSRAELLCGEAKLPLTITPENPMQFEGLVPADKLQTGSYSLRLGDQEGHVSKQGLSFGIRMISDAEPKVKMKLQGVGGMVTKRAMIPWEVRIQDDYGVAAVSGRYRAIRPDGEKGVDEKAAALKIEGDPFPVLLDGVMLPAKKVQLLQVLDLEKLAVAEGSNLSLWINATDNDNIGPANVGRCADMSLKVVTEEEFRASILEREKELRLELERQLKASEELLTDVKALRVTQNSDAKGDVEPLLNLARRQKGVATVLQSIANRLQGIVEEIAINRIEGDEAKLQRRLKDQVVTPLQKLAAERIPAIVSNMDKGRREAKTGKELAVCLTLIETEQAAVSEEIRLVLAAMSESEDFQKAVNMLYEIQRAQQDVLRRTQQEKERRIREALDQKGAK